MADRTLYTYKVRPLGKARLVLEIIKDFVKMTKPMSLDELEESFPRALQGSHETWSLLASANELFLKTGHKRFYLDKNDQVHIGNEIVVVSNQWGVGNINQFINTAENLGYEIHKLDPENGERAASLEERNELREDDVIPLAQSSRDEKGEFVTKRVKPLTYALLSFVKTYLKQSDTVDISDDENFAQWQFVLEVEGEALGGFINTNEIDAIISIDVYLTESKSIEERARTKMLEFIISTNAKLPVGQLQIVDTDEKSLVRYHNSIDVSGLASEDPSYRGPHLVHPLLIQNMYEYARGIIQSECHNVRRL
jgi:hypothetical protein